MRRSSPSLCIRPTPAHSSAGLELRLQRHAGPRETAHDRTDRHLHYLSSLLVAKALDRHEQQGGSLIRRQEVDGAPHLGEGKACFDAAHRLIRAQPLLWHIALLFADVTRADQIDPNRLHNAKHPAVEPRTLLKLVLACERALARSLNQIVGIADGSREPAGKATQPRQDGDQLVAEPDARRIPTRNQAYRRSRQSVAK